MVTCILLCIVYKKEEGDNMRASKNEIIEELNELATTLVEAQTETEAQTAFWRGFSTARIKYIEKLISEWEETT